MICPVYAIVLGPCRCECVGNAADHDFIGLRLGFGEAGENYEQDKAI
jgi:hypothetical protein